MTVTNSNAYVSQTSTALARGQSGAGPKITRVSTAQTIAPNAANATRRIDCERIFARTNAGRTEGMCELHGTLEKYGGKYAVNGAVRTDWLQVRAGTRTGWIARGYTRLVR